MTRPRALVTGSTGFVGMHLTRHLASQGWEVARLLRRDLESLEPSSVAGTHDSAWDGTTESAIQAVAEAAPNVVFHLASLFVAEHGPADVVPLTSSNVVVGAQIAEAMLQCDCRRLVNTGTSWQRGAGGSYDPVCLYAATKQAYEDLLAYYVSAEGFGVITLRLYDTYGPYDRRAKLFSALRTAVASGSAVAMSPGDQLLDLVHIDDVVRAFAIAGERLLQGKAGMTSYDVSSGRHVTLKDVARMYGDALGREVPVAWGERPYRRREVMVPPPGQALPGWEPTIRLEDGITTMEAADVERS